MANDKIMNFNEFAKKTPLQEPNNALKGDNVDPKTKEKFVDQVKKADLTSLTTNAPDYSKVSKIDEDAGQATALQSEITGIERQIVDLQAQLQDKKEALTAIVTTTTTTIAPVAQAATPQPAVQPLTGGTTPMSSTTPMTS